MPRDVLKLSESGLGWARLGKCSNSPFQHSKKCLKWSVCGEMTVCNLCVKCLEHAALA